ncbi:MAG: MMPL family transporter [Candidatus Sericytochromatia bacterium]
MINIKLISKLIANNYKKILFLFLGLFFISIAIIVFHPETNLETDITGVKDGESYKVREILKSEFDTKMGNSSAIVIKDKKDTNELINQLNKNFGPYIAKILDFTTEEHKKGLIFIQFKVDVHYSEAEKLTPKIRTILSEWAKKNNTEAFCTGNDALQYDAKTSSKNDSFISHLFALSISFIILIFTFGNFISALLPILSAFLTIIFFTAIVKFTGMPISVVSQILSGLTGLALATDYSLFIISRFKEESNIKTSLEEIIDETLKTSGKTIFFSGLIMICSILSLYLPDISITRSVVNSIIIIIIISLINSIIFLPALSILLKNKISVSKNFVNEEKKELFWANFTTHIIKYPKFYFILSAVILLSLAYPVLNIKLYSPVINVAPSNSESIKGYEILKEDGWAGKIVPVNIVVEAKENSSVYSPDFISFTYDLTEKLKKHNKVSNVESLTTWNKNFGKNDYISFYHNLEIFLPPNPIVNSTGKIALINVAPKDLIDLSNSFEIIDFVKEETKNTEYNVSTGGLVARVRDLTTELYRYVPQMLLLIFIGIYILIFLHIKSFVIPIKAGIMNFLPILASFGILTLIFQHGLFSNILNTPINNAVTNIVPVILFCVIFGLSMDYEILILSRITEEYHKTKNVQTSIVNGLSKSSSLITGASFILIAVFIPGCLSSSPQIKEICIGMISAIILDATIVRLVMVPSFMMLMGKWNWVGLK